MSRDVANTTIIGFNLTDTKEWFNLLKGINYDKLEIDPLFVRVLKQEIFFNSFKEFYEEIDDVWEIIEFVDKQRKFPENIHLEYHFHPGAKPILTLGYKLASGDSDDTVLKEFEVPDFIKIIQSLETLKKQFSLIIPVKILNIIGDT